ncbi:putative zinc finger CCCH domain-containing protein 9 [Brassica napus]|uniref:putative zinc finger CCCH domain-containing protein 9 n=1 Tax=Brassica napus TaxID=3708 RepID=UPI0020787F48|nr:putative zinc finger CCCH domain-containing protein 9 [Brassica napus]
MRDDEYPVRPGKEDCSFYLKTGRCDFGERCRFNHPKELPKELSLQKCKFFLGGKCKYGSTCKFKHSKEGDSTEAMRQDQKRQRTESSYGPSQEKRAKTIDKQRREAQNNLQEERLMIPENRNVNAQEQADMERQNREAQEKAQEERRRQIDNERRQARLRLERMKPRVLTSNVDQLREALRDIGIERKEGDGF